MREKPERLYLLDGMALAYRAYFSFINRPLINSKGENTSAIFGFTNTLMKILNEDRPDHIAVVFDTREPTFRHVMYDQYKATREKMPEDMASQMDKLKEVVQAFNVPSVELPGFEADDIMGTLARRAEREQIETYLVTGDKDFMQLVSPLIKIYKPGKQGDEWETLDEKAVMQKFGVAPEFVIDVLGLIGDTSDNVPGVPGIGEKTAIPLVRQYGTIEKILKKVESIPQKGVQQKLRDHRDKALLSKRLVTIDTQVPLDIDFHDLNAKPRDNARLAKLFAELEFRTLLKKVSQPDTIPALPVETPELSNFHSDKHEYHLVSSEKELKKLVSVLKKSGTFVFDTETTSTDALQAELVGISFAVKPREAWYVPVKTSEALRAGSGELERADLFSNPRLTGGQAKSNLANPKSAIRNPQSAILIPLDHKFVLSTLSPIFTDASIKKVGQNIKYDMLVLASHGIDVQGVAFDTMVANYVLRPDAQHNMDAMAKEHLTYETISFDDLTRPKDMGGQARPNKMVGQARTGRPARTTSSGGDRLDIREIEVEKVSDYSCEDADITIRLYERLKDKLGQQGLSGLCDEIEFPLIAVLTDMELAGVSLDVEYLSDLSKDLERQLQNLTEEIHGLAGENFNINSTQQLSKVLFETLKLATVRKTKTGFSTDVGVLETLRHEHPIVEKLLNYRQLQKLKSTYVDALPALINPRTGRLHTSFNQTIAATGRLSSSDPNLQNIPIRTEIGRSIRKAFIPGKNGLLIMSADYSQIELRIMAHISGDEGLKEAFVNGEDIHATTAAKVFGVSLKDVTRDMRRKAKEVNFGIMYGIGPYGLATRLDISQGEAKEIITKYFERFPGVNKYISDTIAKVRQDGFVTTLLGRRRFLPDINSRNFTVRSNAERQAINMPIQGTAADMIKIAMIKIHHKVKSKKSKVKMLLQVHDELVFEVAKREEKSAKTMVSEEMKKALPLSVPIEVEVGVGKNWLEAH
ncbi:MAG TPA: DNA polymerase I [Bacteroidota bacterium]|nr:DNA polymerase I [Bacteroidota bacterium]